MAAGADPSRGDEDDGACPTSRSGGGVRTTQTQPLEHLSFDRPDEVRQGENWRLELLHLAGGAEVGRITVQPGWRWSEHVRPVAGADLCQAPHQQYQVSGRIHVVMADGTEIESGPGEVTSLPPGHDAWVVGDEPVVAIDRHGASVRAARP
ncbi:cupin domain-containing protein [Geodermatophilus sp. SYSU D00698]